MDLSTVHVLEKSSAAVALASWRDRLYLAWTGTDARLNVISAPDGQNFADKTHINEKSFRAVATPSGQGGTTVTYISLGPALAGSASASTWPGPPPTATSTFGWPDRMARLRRCS